MSKRRFPQVLLLYKSGDFVYSIEAMSGERKEKHEYISIFSVGG